MPLHLPEGKNLAVNISPDFDAHSVWMGTFGRSTPGYLSRGEFGAEVGVPRLLTLFERYNVKGTWFTPGHSMQTFPDAFGSIVEAGHEIGAHGGCHEVITELARDAERRIMSEQVAQHEKHVGKRPRGYRSPAWDFTDNTMAILEEFGFEWDSSLMARDFEPYHPRPVHLDNAGNSFGDASRLLEFPVSWYLDDFPAVEYVPGLNTGLGSTDVIYQRWKDHFDYAYRHVAGGVVVFTVHPQTIGRAHHIMMLEKLIDHMAGHDGTWFASLSDIYDTWTDE